MRKIREMLKSGIMIKENQKPIDSISIGVEVKECRECNRGDCESCSYKSEFMRLMALPNDDKTIKSYKQQYAQKKWQLKNSLFYAKLKELMTEEELKAFLAECDKKVDEEFRNRRSENEHRTGN